jgi:hypothetical protein
MLGDVAHAGTHFVRFRPIGQTLPYASRKPCCLKFSIQRFLREHVRILMHPETCSSRCVHPVSIILLCDDTRGRSPCFVRGCNTSKKPRDSCSGRGFSFGSQCKWKMMRQFMRRRYHARHGRGHATAFCSANRRIIIFEFFVRSTPFSRTRNTGID